MDSRVTRKALLAGLAGAMLALAMPGIGFGPLVFVALVPLFLALEGRGGFWVGCLAGAAFFAIDLRWILTLVRFSWLAAPGYVVGVAYLALYFGVFGVVVAWARRRLGPTAALLLLAPALFVLLEILRTLGPLGMGFSGLHTALYRIPALIQLAALAGPWAVSLGIVVVNAALTLSLRVSRNHALWGALTLAAMAGVALLPIAPDGDAYRTAILASQVRQEVKLDGRNLDALLARYQALAAEAASGEPDLIVFPESFLPGFILSNDRLLGSLVDLARGAEARILFGTGDYRGGEIYNSAVLLSQEGEQLGRYDMVRPVPFGEWIPARGFLDFIGLGRFISSFLPRDLSRGDGYHPLDGIGTPICFETTFPEASCAFARRGATQIISVTNDAWFANSSAMRAHFAAAVFRAVETRRTFIQSANGGVSGVVDARGRIVREVVGEEVVWADAPVRVDRSLYVRWGDRPLLGVCLLLALGSLLFRRRTAA